MRNEIRRDDTWRRQRLLPKNDQREHIHCQKQLLLFGLAWMLVPEPQLYDSWLDSLLVMGPHKGLAPLEELHLEL